MLGLEEALFVVAFVFGLSIAKAAILCCGIDFRYFAYSCNCQLTLKSLLFSTGLYRLVVITWDWRMRDSVVGWTCRTSLSLSPPPFTTTKLYHSGLLPTAHMRFKSSSLSHFIFHLISCDLLVRGPDSKFTITS